MKRLNDKGSALVTVIIALAIIGVFAVTSLWVSLSNYEMKITDSKVKDSFYSAENVLDEICVGLQGNVSIAYSKAYSDVMQSYSALSEEQRNANFTSKYVTYLFDQLKSNDNSLYENYNMGLLTSYVDPSIRNSGNLPYAEITCLDSSVIGSDDGYMSTYNTGLVLKGISVKYTDEDGFVSIIDTDISLAIPEMNFVTSEDMPDTFSYSMIGNAGVELVKAYSNVNVSGSVYAGSPNAVNPTNTDVMSLNMKENGIKLNVNDSKFLIAEGTFNISDSSEFTNATDNQIWTDNINVGGATTVNLIGSTYVADDLTLSGDSPFVRLGLNNSGRYIGYGNDISKAADSSAIIINGKNSTLDMSGLDDLFVAGYSFVQTRSILNDRRASDQDNKDVRMGESISLKGNQVAYLVPGECIGVNSAGVSLYNRNPITYGEYQAMINDDGYVEVDDRIVSGRTGHSLSYYLSAGESISQCINTVFVPTASGAVSDGLVYYYISLSPDAAREYYKDYFGENTDKLSLYTDFFVNAIKSNDAASRVYTAGKYSLYESETLSLMDSAPQSVDQEIAMLENTYVALNSTLTTSYQSGNNLAYSKPVFDNLIDKTILQTVTNGQSGNRRRVTYNAGAGDVMTAVVVNGAYTYNNENQESGALRLIIATGDVVVKSDFTGTIITLGKIIVDDSCTIKNEDPEKMKRLLTAAISDTEYSLYNVFNDGSSYIVSVTGGGNGSSTSSIAYSDIIKYKNWTKR